VGLSFGRIRSILFFASLVHAFGSRQLWDLSAWQGLHWQYAEFLCGSSGLGVRSLMEDFISSATEQVWCFSIKHFAAFVFNALGSVLRWYHAGSWALSWGVICIAARFVLNFRAVFIILCISLFIMVVFMPLVGADQRCRKGFIIAFLTMHSGADFSTIRSVIRAHSGRVGAKLRYAFSHMILIASFLASRSSRSRPPIVIGFVRVSLAMRGEELSSHIVTA